MLSGELPCNKTIHWCILSFLFIFILHNLHFVKVYFFSKIKVCQKWTYILVCHPCLCTLFTHSKLCKTMHDEWRSFGHNDPINRTKIKSTFRWDFISCMYILWFIIVLCHWLWHNRRQLFISLHVCKTFYQTVFLEEPLCPHATFTRKDKEKKFRGFWHVFAWLG